MDLFYRKYGEGPPLIILHGLYGDSSNWVTIARHLEKNYTVFVPDMRNHGNSPHSQVHDYMAMSSDIAEFIEKKSMSKVSLLGHSMGGKTAMTFSAKNPDKVASLIIADISPFIRSDQSDKIPRFHQKVLGTLLNTDISSYSGRAEIEEIIAEMIGDTRTASFLLKNLYRMENGRYGWRLNARSLYDNLNKLMGTIPADISRTVTGFPVLFIKGSESGYLPESHFPMITDLFPAAEFKIIEGAGHWLHAEKPEEFSETVLSFLEGGY
ncbi:MAG: alpha/beta fold hydrolase [Bacteroidales bacterium]